MSSTFSRYLLILLAVALVFETATDALAQSNPPLDSLHRLWLLRGQNRSPLPDNVASNQSGVNSSWISAAPCPYVIARYAAAQNGDSLYIVSGFSNGFAVNSVRRYDALTNMWTSLADIPAATEGPIAVYYNSKIYVADGYGAAGQDMLRIYDLASDSWSAGSVRPGVTASYGGAIAAYNNKIYFVGGLSSDNSTVVSIYDIASGTWSSGAPPPAPFYNGGYRQVGQYLYLVGGFTSDASANSTVTMRYDLTAGSWSIGPVFTPQRGDFALAASGTKLFAIGGSVNGANNNFFNPSSEVDELETSSWPNGSWQVSPDALPVARQANKAGFFTSTILGGEIWSTGGFAPGDIYLSDHLYRAAPAQANATPPVALSAVSRKTHGLAGAFDLNLPLNGTPALECRSGGPTGDYQIVVNFGTPVTVTGSPPAKVVQGIGAIGTNGASSSVSVAGSSVIIPLTNVANAQTLLVTLSGVSNSSGTTDVTIPIRVLIGDSNGDGSVNSADVAQVRSHAGQAISASTMRYDLNADGAINSADAVIVNNSSGTNVRPAGPLSVVSRKLHGSAGVLDIPLPLSGPSGIEPRTGGRTGDYQIVVQFAVSIAVTGLPQATVTSGSGKIGSFGNPNGGTVIVTDSTVTILLTNVATGQELTVTLNNVTDGNGIGSFAIPMRVLVGDTNGDGLVNSADAAQIRNHSGQSVTPSTVRFDLNADGLINSGDAALVRANSGTGLGN